MAKDHVNLKPPPEVLKRWKTLTQEVMGKEHWVVLAAGIVELLKLPGQDRLDRYGEVTRARSQKRMEEFLSQYDQSMAPPAVAKVGIGGGDSQSRVELRPVSGTHEKQVDSRHPSQPHEAVPPPKKKKSS